MSCAIGEQWRIQREFARTAPLELNYFIFMGNLRKNEAKIGKRTPVSEFEPPYPEILDPFLENNPLLSFPLTFPMIVTGAHKLLCEQ